MKFHRKSTALALAGVSTVLLVAGVVSASAQSGANPSPKVGKGRSTETSRFVYNMHLPPGKFFRVTYGTGLHRIDSSDVAAKSETSGALSRAVFAGDNFVLGTAIHPGRFSGDLTQTLIVDSATLHGIAHFPAAGTVTLTNTDTGTRITLHDGERFSIPTG
jgi:hypothetical protein